MKLDLYKKPFRFVSIVGCIYLIISIILNVLTGFVSEGSVYPYADLVSLIVEGIALVLFVFTIIFYNKHYIFYFTLELLVFLNLYANNVYISLFLSSLLLVLILTEYDYIPPVKITVFIVLEIVKCCLVIPYGAPEFFRYVGLTLFAFCAIGFINLLFHHAYTKNDTTSISLDDYKFTDRQKDCIKEVVLNNTTIKALAITHKVSESAIKKDLATIYDVLGITGKADLKALFIGYKFED